MRVLTVLTLGLTLDRFSNAAAGVLPSRNTEYHGKTDTVYGPASSTGPGIQQIR